MILPILDVKKKIYWLFDILVIFLVNKIFHRNNIMFYARLIDNHPLILLQRQRTVSHAELGKVVGLSYQVNERLKTGWARDKGALHRPQSFRCLSI